MIDLFTQSTENRAISVTELNRLAKSVLEDGIARVWVEGEISNLSRPGSGHVYFSLKDATSQISCAWFRQRQRGPTHNLKNGDQVLLFGKVSIYEARGNYQMIVEQLDPAGEGELRRKFEALKKSLAAEGLFEEDNKQALPALPNRIGIVTSPSGAAVRDIISVLQRRFPAIPIVIYPTAVQGVAAQGQIVAAIENAVRRNECDVLIVARGGGSLEDLWPFNEERVARAIFACPIPLISAVGHEVDFTIADFVADVRAPTPSGAAELVVPDQIEWRSRLDSLAGRIVKTSRRHLEDRYQALDWLSKRLAQCSPVTTVRQQRARLQNLRQTIVAAMRARLGAQTGHLAATRLRLLQRSPATEVQRRINRTAALGQRLQNAGQEIIERPQQRLLLAARTLHSVSPLATLDRGYAIVSDAASGEILHSATAINVGSTVRARLAQGSLVANVTDITARNETDAQE